MRIAAPMRAGSLEELIVYQKALAVAHEVSALLKRPCFQRDRRLFDQLADSSDACPSLISDGYAQSTDKFFAQLCYRSKGEAKETRTHLIVARGRDYITDSERESLCAKYEEVERMLTSLNAVPFFGGRQSSRSSASFSYSTTSSGVMNSRPAKCAGRSSGVELRKSQMPWRSGWPSGVRGSGVFCWAWTWRAGTN